MRFRGEFWRLSNMSPAAITYNGVPFTCTEAAYQAAKFIAPADRQRFVGLDGFAAKRLARQLERAGRVRRDWLAVRVQVMREVLALKFADPALMAWLKTIPGVIVEDNEHGDTFWGRCAGIGRNVLGLLLMELRDGRPYLLAA